MSSGRIGIYGAGGFGREVAWLVSSLPDHEVAAYIDDGAAPGQSLGGLPVLTRERFLAEHPDAPVAVAVGDPAGRERIVRACEALGLRFATLVHPGVERSGSVVVGAGSIICAGSILTVDVAIGLQVHVNLDCTIGHDAVLGDYATLAPGVHVSGNVHVGRSVYIGTGASIINGAPGRPLVIGDGAVIGAGACVTGDCEPGCLHAGVPARLKKRYR